MLGHNAGLGRREGQRVVVGREGWPCNFTENFRAFAQHILVFLFPSR